VACGSVALGETADGFPHENRSPVASTTHAKHQLRLIIPPTDRFHSCNPDAGQCLDTEPERVQIVTPYLFCTLHHLDQVIVYADKTPEEGVGLPRSQDQDEFRVERQSTLP
jgi:hypothetical protein